MRICFAGTPGFAASHLQTLIDSDHQIVAVYTQPDRPSGRGKKRIPSSVKALALEVELPVLQPASLKSLEEQEKLRALDIDLLVVVAYGLILPQPVLDIPRYGCINVHASLLPRWRGAAPIERAILSGDSETGVTIMKMDAGLDTGDMLLKTTVSIEDTDDRVSLETKLQKAGCPALLQVLSKLEHYLSTAEKQQDQACTYAHKIDKSEAQIDWEWSAQQIDRLVRVGIGRVPAFCRLGGERMRILRCTAYRNTHPLAIQLRSKAREHIPTLRPGMIVSANKNGVFIECQDSLLSLFEVQFPGKNAMGFKDVLNSRKAFFTPGKQLLNGNDGDSS